jgi:ribonuclease BN (tRNA processing enzyme)
MEEGGGDSFAEVAKRLEAWALRGRREIDDVAEYLAAIGIKHLHNDHPNIGSIGRRLQALTFD